jgi:hypothetical protein
MKVHGDGLRTSNAVGGANIEVDDDDDGNVDLTSSLKLRFEGKETEDIAKTLSLSYMHVPSTEPSITTVVKLESTEHSTRVVELESTEPVVTDVKLAVPNNNSSTTSKSMLDVSGRPNTRDYGKALEALKLLTENILRGPHNRVMGTT